ASTPPITSPKPQRKNKPYVLSKHPKGDISCANKRGHLDVLPTYVFTEKPISHYKNIFIIIKHKLIYNEYHDKLPE
ncbi:MAG: hypothetical protein ABH891_03245, partial [Candidatus Omnitrophota bacterium]